MKVYVAEQHFDYEGFNILGVFSTELAAQKKCNEQKFGDSFEVTEHDVKD